LVLGAGVHRGRQAVQAARKSAQQILRTKKEMFEKVQY
jgi:hypothetical protein